MKIIPIFSIRKILTAITISLIGKSIKKMSDKGKTKEHSTLLKFFLVKHFLINSGHQNV